MDHLVRLSIPMIVLALLSTAAGQTQAPVDLHRRTGIPELLSIHHSPPPMAMSRAPVSMEAPTSWPSASQETSIPPTPFETKLDVPVLDHSFTAINSYEVGDYNGSLYIPSDAHGAAGPSHLVNVVNSAIQWYTKSGTLVGGKRLGHNDSMHSRVGSFFESLNPISVSFDPKVIYDQFAERFVVVAVEKTTPDPPLYMDSTSRILIAVSATNNPTGSWHFWEIDSNFYICGAYRWADYPCIAVDDKAIYITANMSGFYSSQGAFGQRLWIVHKGIGTGGFYDGGSAVITCHDPYAEAGIDSSSGTLQPAHRFGLPPGDFGTYLVALKVYPACDSLRLISVTDPLGTPTFTYVPIPLGNIISDPLPDAPQLISSRLIETVDMRCLHTVWRSTELWGVMHVNPASGADAGQATVFWFRIKTDSLSLLDYGFWGGEDLGVGTHTFYPSIAVDSSLNVSIGFGASGPSIYPGAYFTGRLAIDERGSMRGSGVLGVGTDFYNRGDPNGNTSPWGDFSATSVDPSDGSFWIFNQFAISRDLSDDKGIYSTAWGRLSTAALPIQLASFTGTVVNGNSVRLDWRTISERNNFGFQIEKSLNTPANYQSVPNGFVPGHGTANQPHDYSFSEPSVSQGVWYYRIKQIDLDGGIHYHEGVRVEVVLTSTLEALLPVAAALLQNYPNPFNSTTTIHYQLPISSYVSLKVFDLLGREVAVLVSGVEVAGNKLVRFDASHLTSGVYLYELQAGDYAATKRLIVLR